MSHRAPPPVLPWSHRLPDPAATDDTRRELFLRLTGAYPTLPLSLILSAVEQYECGIALCGGGAVERAAMDVVTDHNLSAAARALDAASERRKAADEVAARVGPH